MTNGETAPASPNAAPLPAASRGWAPAFLRRWISALRGGAPGGRPTRRAKRLIRRSGLFDPAGYAADGDLGGYRRSLIDHYLRHGSAEHRRPNRLFDPRWYLERHPDVRRAGAHPLLHYITTGEAEGRRPHPGFDPAWYADANPDVGGRAGALRHYLKHGARELRAPSAEFDPRAYLAANPDIERLGMDPLSHWIEHGEAEGRPLHAPEPAVPAAWRLTYGGASDGVPSYRLEPGPAAYTYAPPRPPDDLLGAIAALRAQPRFSIVTPVYNVDPALLAQAVQSVRAQWWPHWELILVDDASPRAETRAALGAFADDPRIQVEFASENRGIAGATNAALARATGDYVVFLDNDDELTPDCLYELALRIDQTEADYIYSDEDKISPDGAFVEPFFKPGWSPDAFMSTMYTCHVSCVRRTLVERLGRLRLGFDGAQDYEFILRVTEAAQRIEHIAKVLYHWRILPSSTASAIEAKPQAIDAAKRAKESALERRGLKGELEYMERVPGQFRVNYFPQKRARVSIVIPSKNNAAVLRRCIESIREITAYPDYEIVLVDNGSDHEDALAYAAELAEQSWATVVSDPAPFNFSRMINLGVRHATGELLLLLNDDTEVLQTDWLARMAGYAELPHVGAVGAKLLYPNGLIQHCGVINLQTGPCHAFLNGIPDNADYFGRHLLEYNWSATTGACFMIERLKFDKTGGLDEDFPIAYNDIDLCFSLIEAGYFNLVCQAVRLVHFESISRGVDAEDPVKMERLWRDWKRLYAKHPAMVDRDPFHSPNLSPLNTFFSSEVV